MKEKLRSYFDKMEKRRTGNPGMFFTLAAIVIVAVIINSCAKNKYYDPAIGDPLKTNIAAIVPSNMADSVFVDPMVTVTFKEDVDPGVVGSATIILKNGTAEIPGTMSLTDSSASFISQSDLLPESEYSATVRTDPGSNAGNNALNEYSWKFKTGRRHRISSLSVVSVSPADKASAVAITVPIIITFNQDLTSAMMKSITVQLKRGSSDVTGTSTFSGNTLIFQPNANLTEGTLYTGKIGIVTSGGYDTDKGSVKNFLWNFTTSGNAPDVTAPVISSVAPANNATSVATSSTASVIFSEAINPTTVNSSSFTLKQGSSPVAGTVSYTGTTAVFTPAAPLASNTVYTGTVTTAVKDLAGNALAAQYSWTFTTVNIIDVTAPTVVSVVPASASTTASTSTRATVTFSEAMNPSTLNSTTFTLKKGSVAVAGTVAYSGTTATFTPTTALAANTVYTGTISTGAKDLAGNALATAYTWSFTTAAAADVTPPTVVSVTPAAGSTAIATGTKPTVTFSEIMDASTINSSTFTLKQGSTTIAGSVSYTGTVATFTPSTALTGNMLYTCTLTTGVKDVSSNAMAAAYTWSFTTAVPVDVTPPTVTSVNPANSSTGVVVNSAITAIFSEAMNATTISGSTFMVKQGATAVSGTVTYTGTTATFTPSAALAGNTVYTCTITTGATDVAGNAIASNYTWSFTTVASAPAGKSFAADVVPILNLCNTCHTHPWTPSATASTFYASLLSGGYINPTNPTSGKIYTKLTGGHPPGSTVSAAQVTTILTWITEGSKNN
jgi:hypothetical protein